MKCRLSLPKFDNKAMKINTKTVLKFVTDPKTAGAAVFLGVGAYKTGKDYRKAVPEEKRRVLAKDAAILLGSTSAFMIMSRPTKLLCDTKFVQGAAKILERAKNSFKKTGLYKNNLEKLSKKLHKFLHGAQKAAYSSLQTSEHIAKECIGGVLNTFAGILGAIYADAVMEKLVLHKPFFNMPVKVRKNDEYEKKVDEMIKDTKNCDEKTIKTDLVENSSVFKNFNFISSDTQQTAQRVVGTIADLPEFKVLEKPLIALTGYSIAQVDGYHNKFKKTTFDLLANTLVPTFFVSIASMIVENAKPKVKYPVLLSSLALGAFCGNKIANKYKDKINAKIDKIDMRYIAIK